MSIIATNASYLILDIKVSIWSIVKELTCNLSLKYAPPVKEVARSNANPANSYLSETTEQNPTSITKAATIATVQTTISSHVPPNSAAKQSA